MVDCCVWYDEKSLPLLVKAFFLLAVSVALHFRSEMFLGEYCAEFLYRFVWRKPDIEIVERNPLVELKYKILGGIKGI